MNVIERVQASWRKVVHEWKRGTRLAHEIEVEKRDAVAAVDADVPGSDERAARTLFAWRAQIKLLEQKEHKTLDDELQLVQLRKSVVALDQAAAIRHPTPENMGPQRLAAFGPVGAPRGLLSGLPLPPWAAIFSSPTTWMVILFTAPAAWGAVQTARLNHAKGELEQVREAAVHNAHVAEELRAQVTAYATAAADAQQAATTTAHALEAERTRAARARRREQERNRAIQDVLTHSPEPPSWSLRNDAHPDGGSSAPDASTPNGAR